MGEAVAGIVANPASERDIQSLRSALRVAGVGRVMVWTDAGKIIGTVRRMVDAGASVLICLGNATMMRAAAAACGDVPLLMLPAGGADESAVAGLAAGLVATGRVGGDAVRRTKRVEVAGDFALIDAASCRDRFVGARAIWDPQKVQALVLARAEPWSVGLSAIGGALCPVTTDDPCGLWVELGSGGRVVSVPVAPGLVLPVPVRRWRRLDLEEPVPLGEGPGTIALDGERELGVDGATAARVTRSGPWLVDIREALLRGSGDD